MQDVNSWAAEHEMCVGSVRNYFNNFKNKASLKENNCKMTEYSFFVSEQITNSFFW